MPQKENPDAMELVRATAGDAAGALQGLVATLKGLPRAYNRDLQRATPHAWGAVDAVTAATDVAAGAVATATWDEAALAEAAGEGFATATGVADLLARAGVPFRTAHEVVATAARASEDPGYDDLDAAARETLGKGLAANVDREAVEAALSPAESVASRDSVGGPAPGALDDQLDAATGALESDRETVFGARAALAAAAAALDAEVATYA
jgi:argininosuccinate lyase